jgi:hypothetical protein
VTGVNSSGESPKSTAAFAFASSHYSLAYYNSGQIFSLPASGKQYYRLPVTAGSEYTIQWQNGKNENADASIWVDAWQNDGTVIFASARWGYTEPRKFTAAVTGYVTVEVRSSWNGGSLEYQIYYY